MQVPTPELRAGDIVGDGSDAYFDVVTRVTRDADPRCVVVRVDVIRVLAASERTVRTHWYAGAQSCQDVWRRGPVVRPIELAQS